MSKHRGQLEKVMQDGMNQVLRDLPSDPFALLLERISEKTRAGLRHVRFRAWPVGQETIALDVIIYCRNAEVAVHRAELPKAAVARGLAAAAATSAAANAAIAGAGVQAPWATEVPATPAEAEAMPVASVAAMFCRAFGEATSGVPFLSLGELHRKLCGVFSSFGGPEFVTEDNGAQDLQELCARLQTILMDAAGNLVDGTSLGAVQASFALQRLRSAARAGCRDEIIQWQHQWPELLLPALVGSTPRRRLCIGVTMWAAASPEVAELEGAEASEPVDISAFYARAVAASQRAVESSAAIDDDDDDEGALEPDQYFPPLNCVRNAAAVGAAVVAKVAASGPSFPAGEDFAGALAQFRQVMEADFKSLADPDQGAGGSGGGSPSAPSRELQQSPSIYVGLDVDADAAFDPAAGNYTFAEGGEVRTLAELIDYYDTLCEAEPLLRLLLSPISRRDPSRGHGYRTLRSRLASRGVVVVEDEADEILGPAAADELQINNIINVDDETWAEIEDREGSNKAKIPAEKVPNLTALLLALTQLQEEGENSDLRVLGRAVGGASLTVEDFRLGRPGEFALYSPEHPPELDAILKFCVDEFIKRHDGIRVNSFAAISRVMYGFTKSCLKKHESPCLEEFREYVGGDADAFNTKSSSESNEPHGHARDFLCAEALRRRAFTLGFVSELDSVPAAAGSSDSRAAAIENLPTKLANLDAQIKAAEAEVARLELDGERGAAAAAGVRVRALREQQEELIGDPFHFMVDTKGVVLGQQEQEEEDRLWDLLVAPRAVGRRRGLGLGPLELAAQYQRSARSCIRTHGVYDFGARPATVPALASYVDVSMALPESSRRFMLPQTSSTEELLQILLPLEVRVRGILCSAYRLDLPPEDMIIKRLTQQQLKTGLQTLGFEQVTTHTQLLFKMLDLRNAGSVSSQDFEVFQHVQGPLSLEDLDGFRLWISAWSSRRRAEAQEAAMAAAATGRHISPDSGTGGETIQSPFAEVWQIIDLPGPSGARSGTATFKQFKAALRQIRHPAASKGDGRSHELFLSLDLDNKGYISESDFFMLNVLSARFQLQRVLRVRDFLEQRFGSLKSAFKAMDKNRMEQLATDSWMEMMETQQLYPDMEDARATCQFLDMDASHTLTPNDFGVLLKELREDDFLRELAALKDHIHEVYGGVDEAYSEFKQGRYGLDANSFLKGCKACNFRGPCNYDPRLLFNFLDASHCGRLSRREFSLL
jgi:Ca2+-binding EF-hand superfamily protein